MLNIAMNQKIKEKFGVDVISDYTKNQINDLLFCFDWTKKGEAEVIFLRGNSDLLNFLNVPNPKLSDILSQIEIVNPISEVYGKDNFIDSIIQEFNTLEHIEELYVPFRVDNKVVWVCLNFKALSKLDGENQIICGNINWVSYKVPRAIKYYQNRYKDSATNLFTKNSLRLHLSLAQETDHSYGLFFDIDNFKRINDIFGHRSGDTYLRDLAASFISNFENDVIYYRIGGDEFFVYLKNCTEEYAYRKALDIIYIVETLNPEGQQAEVSASVGIVPVIGNNFDFDDLLDLADKTMYVSKSKGKGNISYAREV